MAHPSHIVTCSGPQDPHAFDGIPVQPRRGELDRICPVCAGHGQWNVEFDLVSQRSKRAFCDRCGGRGWIETGDDPLSSPDIERPPGGAPRWVTRYSAPDDGS